MGPTREASRRVAASLWHAVARARASRASAGSRGSVPALARRDALRVVSLASAGPSPGKRHPPVAARGAPPPTRGFAGSTVGTPTRRDFHVSVFRAAAGDSESSSSAVTDFVSAVPPTVPRAAAAVASLSEAQRAALLEALLANAPRLTKDDTASLFSEADVDKDETLSREEFDRVLIRFGDRGYRARGGKLGGTQGREAKKRKEENAGGAFSMTGDAARALFLSQAIPFVGFGFMDNAIMIIAGEYIEMSIGAALALSTMAAAGLGNLLSDIAGIGFSSKIESLTETFLKIRPPELSRAAASSFNARFVKMLGAVVGVSVGCLLGMFPLLFFDADHDHNLRPDEDGDAKKKKKKGGGKEKDENTPRANA